MREEIKNQNVEPASQGIFGLPVYPDVLFSNHKNIYRRSVEKRQRKLLAKISFIRPFLNAGEKIIHVTTGCSPVSSAEQLLTGWIVFYLKRSIFVFTNMRIFHIPTKHDFSYRNSIAQILYSDCRKIYMHHSRLITEYKTGEKEQFPCIAWRERKKLKLILEYAPIQGQPSDSPGRTHLCPRCTNPLIKNNFTCPNCSLEFKNKARGRKLSIVYPGGGYFYARHPFLGIADALVESYLSLLVLVAFIGVVTGTSEFIPGLVLFSFILALEKAISVYHSNHFIDEFIPKDHKIELLVEMPQYPPQSVPPQEQSPPRELKPEEILSAAWRGQ
jgi:hypothetical protein